MSNKEAAEMFAAAIKELADNPNSLNNMESYLAQHFDTWLAKYAISPGDMAGEMKSFAEIKF